MRPGTGRKGWLFLRPDQVGLYVLMPGDPSRAAMIGDMLDEPQKAGQLGGVAAYIGWLNGAQVSVVSSGISGPAAAAAVEGLAELGADTFIRVGTSGVMQPWVQSGDLVVALGSVRDEGASRGYLPLAYPAAAHPAIVAALAAGCAQSKCAYHVGLVHSKDSLYGEWEPKRMPVSAELRENWQTWIKAGVLCSEMELAAIMTVAAVLRKRAGGLLIALKDDRPLEPLCRAAVRGLQELIERDRRG